MFRKDDVKAALKLTEKQVDDIDAINKDLQKDLRELSGGRPGGGFGLDPETQQKREKLQKAALDDIVKMLNAKQKETYKDLTGEPFTLTFTFPGFGGFGTPGQLLSSFTQDQLKLTAEQKKKLEELQKDVDAKLDKILTDEQRKQFKDMRQGPRLPGAPPGGGQ
jgi:hypothetical protein